MLGDDLKQFVPEMLEARYPGRSRLAGLSRESVGPDDPHFGWLLEHDECLVLVNSTSTTHPFISIKGGIGHAIPRSEDLALRVAAANKELMVGRLYMAYSDDMAMVVFDESIVGAYLSLDYQPSVDDLVTRFETSIQYTAQWSKTILEKFGGQPFTVDDWALMML